jgi:hypothetical protein
LIQATFTPKVGFFDPNVDLEITALAHLYSPEEFAGLPVELDTFNDGVQEEPIPFIPIGLSEYSNGEEGKMQNPKLFIPGRGIAAIPGQIPVLTQRARDSLAKKGLSETDGITRVTLVGSQGFKDAIIGGIPVENINLGDGI